MLLSSLHYRISSIRKFHHEAECCDATASQGCHELFHCHVVTTTTVNQLFSSSSTKFVNHYRLYTGGCTIRKAEPFPHPKPGKSNLGKKLVKRAHPHIFDSYLARHQNYHTSQIIGSVQQWSSPASRATTARIIWRNTLFV